jgi:hypothetical protein
MILRCSSASLAVLLIVPALLVGAGTIENEHFQRTWERTDRAVAEGAVARSWVWGPEPISPVIQEPYAESPGGMREVQYFDKARMEITHPETGDPASIWYVTNGLLVFELILGNVQRGDTSFDYIGPAAIPVAGDLDDANSPTYATFSPMYESNLLAAPPRPVGAVIAERVDRHGVVRVDPELASLNVTVAFLDETTEHAVAEPFWAFMNASGPVYESDALVTAQLFENPFFGTGRPITEAYWARVRVGGAQRDVLLQCFERRCLTYTPGNPEGFVVEAGNIGLHYFNWRYGVAE